ncbi:PilN domain-containing protein [Leptolyngbya sp. AN02str]|uniref:PilN domain-containing protein n=1 Tax=Leptolyngbya sp. AN02str TaxID=3423363 RepID=UPI003D315D01
MYSLDINFLNDREERPSEVAGGGVVRGQQESNRPLIIGAIIGGLLPALVGALWLVLNTQNSSLRTRQADLDSQLASLQARLAEVEQINTRVSLIEAENQALASVFDRVKPWSAIIQDLRGRVPAGLQILAIRQTQDEAPVALTPPDPTQPPTTAPEPPPPVIAISGVARSFNDVNDLLALLKQSTFWDPDTLKIESALLVPNKAEVEFQGEQPQGLEVRLPDVVEYTISGELTKRPSSELLQDMRNTLSVGLPARIDALRDLGVVQP